MPHIEHKPQLTLKITPLKSSWKSVLDKFQFALSRFEETYVYHANQHEKLIFTIEYDMIEDKNHSSFIPQKAVKLGGFKFTRIIE